MANIRDLTKENLEKYLLSIDEPKYRTKQIFNWLHKTVVDDLSLMSNVKKTLIEKIKTEFDYEMPKIIKHYDSKIDGTKKFLIELVDGNIIESVLMNYKYGLSICISSQVGCNMGCKFCASTLNGIERNLNTYELLAQVYLVSKFVDKNINNIVIMGSGEPLNNYGNIIDFLKIINDEDGKNISLRNVTISTCGIVENIYKLANENLNITLALSLHAPNDSIRKTIMPIANKYTIESTLRAMAEYYNLTNRRITIEYSLIDCVNCSAENAKELVKVLKKHFVNNNIDFNVNLIPVNSVKETNMMRPKLDTIKMFKSILIDNNINVTVRRELGSDISGSCGQLRAKFIK